MHNVLKESIKELTQQEQQKNECGKVSRIDIQRYKMQADFDFSWVC